MNKHTTNASERRSSPERIEQRAQGEVASILNLARLNPNERHSIAEILRVLRAQYMRPSKSLARAATAKSVPVAARWLALWSANLHNRAFWGMKRDADFWPIVRATARILVSRDADNVIDMAAFRARRSTVRPDVDTVARPTRTRT